MPMLKTVGESIYMFKNKQTRVLPILGLMLIIAGWSLSRSPELTSIRAVDAVQLIAIGLLVGVMLVIGFTAVRGEK